jgi:hypothetical protein
MATSGDTKAFKQDMVVSIRYRNDLPPPPMPPKLLDIDTGGLAQYLTTGYASALAKREEPNVEVDAEGGMPIDMVGVPGYFLGDESAIMAPEVQPVLDPADHALLLSLEQLKSQGVKNNVSFLRKTQYMTAAQMARATLSNDPLLRSNNTPKRKMSDKAVVAVARDDKENIKGHIQKGFDLAYPDSVPYNPPEARANPITPQERDAWKNPVHPDNPSLKPVEFYPVLPDLDAVTDMAANWQALKFDKPPLAPHHGRRDDRVEAGLIMAAENTAETAKWTAKQKAYEENPNLYEDPGPQPYLWSLAVPKQVDSTARIRRIFDDSNPYKDDPASYAPLLEESADGTQRIPFERVRVYPSASQVSVDPRRFMAVSLVHADRLSPTSRLRKQGSAAYYYPILERVRLKTDRGAVGKSRGNVGDDDPLAANIPDQLMVLFRPPTVAEQVSRHAFRGEYDAAFAAEYAEMQEQAAAEEEEERRAAKEQGTPDVSMAEVDEDAEMAATNGVSHGDDDNPPINGNTTTTPADVDATAEDDEDDDDDDEMRDD